MTQVRVNPTCKLNWEGADHGAGAELGLPPAIAHEKEKQGVVTILHAQRKNQVVQKEIHNDGA